RCLWLSIGSQQDSLDGVGWAVVGDEDGVGAVGCVPAVAPADALGGVGAAGAAPGEAGAVGGGGGRVGGRGVGAAVGGRDGVGGAGGEGVGAAAGAGLSADGLRGPVGALGDQVRRERAHGRLRGSAVTSAVGVPLVSPVMALAFLQVTGRFDGPSAVSAVEVG